MTPISIVLTGLAGLLVWVFGVPFAATSPLPWLVIPAVVLAGYLTLCAVIAGLYYGSPGTLPGDQ